MTNQDKNNKIWRFSIKEIMALIGVIFLCAIIGFAGFFYNFFHEVGIEDSIFGPFISNPTEKAATAIASGETPQPLFIPIDEIPPPEWDGATRVTILVLGVDYRDWIANMGPPRTDTMILLTIDPITKTAGMLSIPRDLWANIPGFKPHKINTAYRWGEMYNYPGGGPGLAMKTVEGTIGVPIDYYARIDFGAFVSFIDLIGGVKLHITEPIELEVIGKEVDVYIEPGVHALGGDIALAYARARHTGGGDFERAERQQQVIMGIRDRLLNPEIFGILIDHADDIFNELSSGIHTNLPLEDAIELAYLALQINDEDIHKAVIGESSFIYGTSPDELSILIPLPDKIREIRDQVFATGGSLTPFMSGEPLMLMQLEGATISVLNGTNVGDLADRTANYLRGQGANVISVGPSGEYINHTTITIYSAKPYTLAYMVSLMSINQNKIFYSYDPNSSVDFEITLGFNWDNNNPMP